MKGGDARQILSKNGGGITEKKTYEAYWVGGFVNDQYDSDVLEARSLKEAMYVFCRDRRIPIDVNVLGLEAYNLLTDEKLTAIQHTDLE